MRKRKELRRQFKNGHTVLQKILGITIAIAGAILIIHTIPAIIWYVILGMLVAAMIIYLMV